MDCPDKIRMQSLALDPRYRDRVAMQDLTKPRVGKWINDSTCVPSLSENQIPTNPPQAQGPNSDPNQGLHSPNSPHLNSHHFIPTATTSQAAPHPNPQQLATQSNPYQATAQYDNQYTTPQPDPLLNHPLQMHQDLTSTDQNSSLLGLNQHQYTPTSWPVTSHETAIHQYTPYTAQSSSTSTKPKSRQLLNPMETRETSHIKKKRVMEATREPPPDQV